MATSSTNIQPNDISDIQPFEDEYSEEETMPPPLTYDLANCQPPILLRVLNDATPEDETIWNEIQSTSLTISANFTLKRVFCALENGSEDYWVHFVVLPILKLAKKIVGLKEEVMTLPLQTATVDPPELLPKWNGPPVSRNIDLGLAIKFDDDVKAHIQTHHQPNGIGPASSIPTLQTRPLFAYFEVKQQYQVIDPLVQLSVWGSAVYARWEQLAADPQQLPITFGWTVTGHSWQLYMLKRIPDGSRQLTAQPRVYNTQIPTDIYCLLATLSQIMKRGNETFRQEFLTGVLNLSNSSSQSKLPILPDVWQTSM